MHRVESLELPGRIITKADYDYALAELETVLDQDPEISWAQRRLRTMIAEYEAGGIKPAYTMELHVIRLGEVAFATNPFELYLDYAVRIQARSHAGQTFLVQIANGTGSYLPSPKGGGQTLRWPGCGQPGRSGGRPAPGGSHAGGDCWVVEVIKLP